MANFPLKASQKAHTPSKDGSCKPSLLKNRLTLTQVRQGQVQGPAPWLGQFSLLIQARR